MAAAILQQQRLQVLFETAVLYDESMAVLLRRESSTILESLPELLQLSKGLYSRIYISH